ncbi:DUF7556 family protein [Natrialbaceae archaeon AArc-T1-2]|uniref:DUF7556 family protein n=1 Tax=Natrialbaceae archaeon AArc-T1-2 TaxID=3053904 RepID=UPI00255AFA54|nr:hypothetical protein [Natrialbaceae archaeon AArc-T1-2]WIV65662.1 hypothetical protein QQ977_08070 [Natrialbaceae archaeon AArc-T1-2]
MVVDPNGHAEPASETIVGAIDASDHGEGEEYIIADISADGAWLSIGAEDAPTLPAWR